MMVMQVAEWVPSPGRKNVAAYFKRMDGRKASQDALAPFGIEVSLQRGPPYLEREIVLRRTLTSTRREVRNHVERSQGRELPGT